MAFGGGYTSPNTVNDPPQTPSGSFSWVLHSGMLMVCEVKEGEAGRRWGAAFTW